jgi:hypothetical protein
LVLIGIKLSSVDSLLRFHIPKSPRWPRPAGGASWSCEVRWRCKHSVVARLAQQRALGRGNLVGEGRCAGGLRRRKDGGKWWVA